MAGVIAASAFTPYRTSKADDGAEGIRQDSHLHGIPPRLGDYLGREDSVPVDYDEILSAIKAPIYLRAPLLDRYAVHRALPRRFRRRVSKAPESSSVNRKTSIVSRSLRNGMRSHGWRPSLITNIDGVICTGNISYDIPVWPVDSVRWGKSIWVEEITFSVGGNGANTSYAMATLGGRIMLTGVVGRDSQGDAVLAVLENAGVQLDIHRSDQPTTSTVVLVQSSE